jgi:hypothetical protein
MIVKMNTKDYNPVPKMFRGMNITPHFTWDELLGSAALLAHNKEHDTECHNEPKQEEYRNITFLCEQLESLRAITGKPLIINSGFRSDFCNKLVGGVPTSRHRLGLAADIHCEDAQHALSLAFWASNIKYSREIIIEKKTHAGKTSFWLHYSVDRNETLGCRIGFCINGIQSYLSFPK